mgnify:CR=1 FL=1
MGRHGTAAVYTFVNPNRDPRAVERALRQILLEKLCADPAFPHPSHKNLPECQAALTFFLPHVSYPA